MYIWKRWWNPERSRGEQASRRLKERTQESTDMHMRMLCEEPVYGKRKPTDQPEGAEGRVTRSRRENLGEERTIPPFVYVPPFPIESQAYRKHLARLEDSQAENSF